MARISAENLDVKIRKAEGKVMRLGDQYNAACEELKELRAKKRAIEQDALIAEGAAGEKARNRAGCPDCSVRKEQQNI